MVLAFNREYHDPIRSLSRARSTFPSNHVASSTILVASRGFIRSDSTRLDGERETEREYSPSELLPLAVLGDVEEGRRRIADRRDRLRGAW